jgi:hypothetical protein
MPDAVWRGADASSFDVTLAACVPRGWNKNNERTGIECLGGWCDVGRGNLLKGDVDLGRVSGDRKPNWCLRSAGRGEWRAWFFSRVWRRERPTLWDEGEFVEAAEARVNRNSNDCQ